MGLLAFTAIALTSAHIFEHVPHSEDEVAYIFQAKVFAQNRLAVPTPPYPQAFWTPFVVDYQGWRFGKYPPGWPLLLSLGVRLDAPWLVNALLAPLTLAMIGWLGAQLYGPEVGLGAAGLGLVTPGFLFLSSSLLSHTASLFWVTLALVATVYLTKPGLTREGPQKNEVRNRHPTCPKTFIAAILAGLALGAAFVTRPFAGLGVGLALGLFLAALNMRTGLKWIILLGALAGSLPAALLLPWYWWAITGDPAFNAYLLVWPYDRIGFGPDIGPYGYGLTTAILNTRLKLTALGTGLFGWPGWSNLIFLPIPFLARQASRWDWLWLGILLSLIIVHMFYWSFGGVDGGFPRYYYEALPGLLLLTARGLQISTAYLARWRPRLGWLPAILAVLLTLYNFIWNLPPLLIAQKGKYDIRPTPLQVVARANLPQPALVIIEDVEDWNDFAAPFAANSPTLDGPVVYAIGDEADFNQQLRRQFRERTCWELREERLSCCP